MRAKLEAVVGHIEPSGYWFFGAALLLLWTGRLAPLSPCLGEALQTLLS